jgi:serine/threonine-protein kinase
MPKAEGSLQDLVAKSGVLTTANAATVLLEIVKGLIEVGDLVHRDLKPDNVLLYNGKWMIADFGIARFMEEATASNTLKDFLSDWYAAPEQWRGERATHSTDIYSLGCIAFCLLMGKPPFTKDPQAEHQNAPIPSFSCADPRFSTLINMCLRKNDASRPSLSRVRDLLHEIVSKPQALNTSSSLGALANAAALVSSKEQEDQARELAEKAASQARMKLAKSAFEILADSAERLWGTIHSQAPNAKRFTSVGQSRFECQLGNGSLVINLDSTNVLGPGQFRRSGWDVVTYSRIMVQQHQPNSSWSSSLWYVKMKHATEYRWYEASYFERVSRTMGVSFAPPNEYTDLAASNIMGPVCIAFGPVVIDDEKEDDFHDRWIWLLSKAAIGKLTGPSRMPFEWPPQMMA